MSILDDFPFPFHKPAGHELWSSIANLVPVPLDAIALAERFGVDPLNVPPGLTPRQLWRVILQTTAARGTTRDLTVDVLTQNLASTRQMDKHTAAMVAQWLAPVVTPGISRS